MDTLYNFYSNLGAFLERRGSVAGRPEQSASLVYRVTSP